MRSYLPALFAVCALPACTNIQQPLDETPLCHGIADQVHSLLMSQDSDSRSLYMVMTEAESLLKEKFPESAITVDVQIEKNKTYKGMGYIHVIFTRDHQAFSLFLSAQNIQEGGEKITAKQVVKKLIWDMRESCRQYLQDRMSIFKPREKKNTEQWLREFLEEEKGVLTKHGLLFNGTIQLSGEFLSFSCTDTYNGGEFGFTVMTEGISSSEQETE